MNKNIIRFLVVVVVVGGVWYFLKLGSPAPYGTPSPSASVSVSVRPSVTPKSTGSSTPKPTTSATPVGTATATPTASPTPGIIIQETKVYTVTAVTFNFSPATLTVKRGDVVVFKNIDSTTHTVTEFNHVFDSRNIRPGDQWTLATTDLAPGTYEYRCSIHTSMHGTLIVQ